MTQHEIAHPTIVSRDEWLAARITPLEHEKELTRHRDRVTAERRRLPMVRIEKDYVFDGPAGQQRLVDLFDGRRQLIVYHFMFDPEWDEGCPSCTGYVDALGDLTLLYARDTSLVLVSRAPLAKTSAIRRAAAGAYRGSRRTEATSTTISTSPWTTPSPRSSTTTAARPSSSRRARPYPRARSPLRGTV